jgi:hypothetical protein
MGKNQVVTALSIESLKPSKRHFKCCEISKGKGRANIACIGRWGFGGTHGKHFAKRGFEFFLWRQGAIHARPSASQRKPLVGSLKKLSKHSTTPQKEI